MTTHVGGNLYYTLGMLISFFPKIDYRFEKIDFFRLSNLGVAISLCHGLLCNVPTAMLPVRRHVWPHRRSSCASLFNLCWFLSTRKLQCQQLIAIRRAASCVGELARVSKRPRSPRRTVADRVEGRQHTVFPQVAGVSGSAHVSSVTQFACPL